MSIQLRKELGRARPRLVDLLPAVLFLLALLVLRAQLAADMGLGPRQALASGFPRGAYYDAVICVLAWALATLVAAVTRTRPGLALSLLGFAAWLASLASVLHYRFFSIGLDWWLVRLHWRDLFVVQGSAAQLGAGAAFYASGALVLAAVASGLGRDLLARWLGLAAADPKARRGVLAVGLLALATGALAWVGPGWFGRAAPGVVLNDNVLHLWAKQVFGSRMVYGGVGTDWTERLERDLGPEDLATPSRLLAAFRDLPTAGSSAAMTAAAAPAGVVGPALDPDWPLRRRLTPDLERSRALRRSLGLPETGPLNVIYLFVESMRAREFLVPEIARHVFPRTHAAIDGKALYFPQTYASAFTAGQTVRGQFATQCSHLPNMLGAAVYLAHTSLRTECIPGLLRAQGYRTLWFNGYDASFHGKRAFETLHGMESFYDRGYFRSRGITRQVGSWGIADREMLQESLRVMEGLAKEGRPFYANVLTIATHHPYKPVAEGPLPPELVAMGGRPDYQGYLSQLVYADSAVGAFFEAFFASPLADDTLVVLVGDHGAPPTPPEPQTAPQAIEMRFRVAMGLVTKHMPRPGSVDYPVHQIDISPMVADILGMGGEVTWMGRNPLDGSGSPWLYTTGDVLHYRVGDRACYTEAAGKPRRCYDLRGSDPLLVPPSHEIPEDPAESALFARVAQANLRALVLNRVAPPRGDAASPASPEPARAAAP